MLKLLKIKRTQDLTIHAAAERGELKVIQDMIDDQMFDVNARDTDLNTPLHCACKAATAASVVDYLVYRGAEPNAANQEGWTPLHCAVSSRNHKTVEYLLKKGKAAPNPRDAAGKTPLHLAVSRGLVKAVHVLLDYKADPNLPDLSGKTPLHDAVRHDFKEVVALLLKHEADVTAVDMMRKTPSKYAKSEEVLTLLSRRASMASRTCSRDSSNQAGRDQLPWRRSSQALDFDDATSSSSSAAYPPYSRTTGSTHIPSPRGGIPGEVSSPHSSSMRPWSPSTDSERPGQSLTSGGSSPRGPGPHPAPAPRGRSQGATCTRLPGMDEAGVKAAALAFGTGVVGTVATAMAVDAVRVVANTTSCVAGSLDPMGGASAVLNLAMTVAKLAYTAVYNKEQVKMLGRRINNVVPILQGYYEFLRSEPPMTESGRKALVTTLTNLNNRLDAARLMLEEWQQKGQCPLAMVNRFLGATFYEKELRDMQGELTEGMVDLTAAINIVDTNKGVEARERGTEEDRRLMQQAAAADRKRFEQYLADACGGYAELQQQVLAQAEVWADVCTQLEEQGVQVMHLNQMLSEVLQGVKDLQLTTDNVCVKLDSQSQAMRGLSNSMISMRESTKELETKVDVIFQYVEAQQQLGRGGGSEAVDNAKRRLPKCVISRDKVDVVMCRENRIERGASGTIYRGRYNLTPVAIKCFELAGADARKLREVYKEAIILGTLRVHPNIVTLYGMVVDPGSSSRHLQPQGSSAGAVTGGGAEFELPDLHGALVMELMETDLAKYLQDHPDLSLKERLHLATHAACGLHYLHNEALPTPIIHGDVKPHNVLVNQHPQQQPQVKLCDFGLSQTTSISLTRSLLRPQRDGGSMLYLAPEMLADLAQPMSLMRKTPATDVFAFGVLLYQVLTGFEPYYEGCKKHLDIQVPRGLRPGFSEWEHREEDMGRQLIALMQRCWEKEAEARPSMIEVYEELRQLLDSC